MYKNNSGLITKTKVSKYKKGLCLTEKLMRRKSAYYSYTNRCAPAVQNPRLTKFQLAKSAKSFFGSDHLFRQIFVAFLFFDQYEM
jgi:hypothetical protein